MPRGVHYFLMVKTIRDTDPARFKALFQEKTQRAENGCLHWVGSIGVSGYGRVRSGTKIHRAHRVAWEIENGPIEEGMHVCHRCDTPKCVEITHLFLGTHAENMRDMSLKGRKNPEIGVKRYNAKLTPERVREIRELAKTHTTTKLAEMFGVNCGVISRVIRRLRWKHVE